MLFDANGQKLRRAIGFFVDYTSDPEPVADVTSGVCGIWVEPPKHQYTEVPKHPESPDGY